MPAEPAAISAGEPELLVQSPRVARGRKTQEIMKAPFLRCWSWLLPPGLFPDEAPPELGLSDDQIARALAAPPDTDPTLRAVFSLAHQQWRAATVQAQSPRCPATVREYWAGRAAGLSAFIDSMAVHRDRTKGP